MGDGKKLKEYLDEKGTNVRRIAKETGISATTLYTIIQKDSNIRFDFALRLANALDIDVNEICSASPFSGVYGVAVAGLAKIFGGYNPVFKDVVPKGIFVSRGLGGAHRAGGVFFRVIKVTFAAANDFHNNEPPVCKWC